MKDEPTPGATLELHGGTQKSTDVSRGTSIQQSPTDHLIAIAIEKDLDIDKLERLFALKEREEEKTAKAAFFVALSLFQRDCPAVFKSEPGAKANYAPYERIMLVAKPHLAANNLSIFFDTAITSKYITTYCHVSHVAGHTQTGHFKCPIMKEVSNQGNRMMNDSQAGASANSYGKRYAVKNALNIVETDQDDDGESLWPVISERDAAALRDGLSAAGASESKFCVWMKVDCLENIRARDLKKAQTGVQAKQDEAA